MNNKNPEWYSSIYHSHRNFKRSRCMKALERIRNGEDKSYNPRTKQYTYDSILRGEIAGNIEEEERIAKAYGFSDKY